MHDIIDDFPELAELDRRNRHAIDERARQLQNEFGQRIENIERERNQSRCRDALDADANLRDRWRAINDDPKFLSWLNQIDELSAERRQFLLVSAYHRGDSGTVCNIFRAFQNEQIPERQRAPAARQPFTGAAPAVRDVGRKLWKRAEIERFYADCRKGLYDEREGERMRIEREILAAARQGRVLNPPVRMRDEK